jgi:putative transcriptional regulator
MDTAPYSNIAKGTFLIAAPEIESGLFFRAVVLICEHSTSGSFGLIINKSIDLELPEDILDMQDLSNPKVGIRAGGPVQPNQMMLLHSSDVIADQTLKICDGVYLGGDLHFLQEAMANPEGPNIRLCFGYAGWSAGQLEREFLDGGWFLTKATAHYLFQTPSERLWQLLLREMGGKYATLSMIPEDLSLN